MGTWGGIFGFRRQVHSSSGTACASLSQQVLQEEPELCWLEGLFVINAAAAAAAATLGVPQANQGPSDADSAALLQLSVISCLESKWKGKKIDFPARLFSALG